jgi:hypothetical protein
LIDELQGGELKLICQCRALIDSSSGLSPSFPFDFLLPFSLRRRGLFDIYICARSQLNSATNSDLIFGLKIAEYWRQVNPLTILRSAAFDVNPFDHAVTDANDERAFCRHGYRRRQDEERRPRSPRGPGHSKIVTVPLA